MTGNQILRVQDFPNDADGDSLRLLAVNGSDVFREMEIDFSCKRPRQPVRRTLVTGLRFALALAWQPRCDGPA
jgi:hypothetical protein